MILVMNAEITALKNQIATEEKKLATLETEVRDLQDQLLRFKAAYENALGMILGRIAVVKSAIAELEHQQHLRTEKNGLHAAQFAWNPPPAHDPVGEAYRRVWEPIAEKTKPLPPLAEPEAAPPDLKKIYRDLARRYHPDHAQNEDDRQFRTQMMAHINAAYAEKDLSTLSALSGESAPHETLAGLLLRQLRQRYDKLRQRVFELKQQRQNLLNSDLMQLRTEETLARATGRDLLQEMAQDAEREYQGLLRRLYQLRQEAP